MYPFRKELVGKRFLCVREKSTNNRPNSRSSRLSNPLEYQWKCGIIRACTEEDSNDPEQKVGSIRIAILSSVFRGVFDMKGTT